jgi:[acyl-carrier-protein] S-malonyltransferase
MDVILLFPGQGSQKPGMGRDLYDALPAAREVFDTADRVLGFPLSRLCFEGPEAELTATQNAQPALLAHSAAAWAAACDMLSPHVRAAAGHSLGEFSAHYASGALALADALRLVRRRAELMQEAGSSQRGGMAAVLGLEPAALDELCRSASAMNGVVVPANYNSPEQTVISGAATAVERAMTMAREAGAKRAMPLNVSGAFHSPLMESAAGGLAAALDRAAFAPARFPVYSNVSVTPAADGAETRSLLLRQLTAPVRWTEQVRALSEAWPQALWVEVGPGKVLTNLVRRILPVADTTTCGTAGDLEHLRSRLAG